MSGLFEDLQALEIAVYLRKSVWVYPLVNTAHLLGIALLIGSVLALDLRLIGLWRRIPAGLLARVLVPVAVTGFGIAVVAGVLLFLVRAPAYAELGLFQAKMAVLIVAVVNAAVFTRLPGWRRLRGEPAAAAPLYLRMLAALSVILWLGVLTLGRFVGYFT